MPFARFAPVTFLSAKTHRRLGSLMPLVDRVAANLDRRVATAQLNAAIRDAVLAHPAPAIGGKLFKVYYVTQPATHPPVFVFSCNDPDLLQSHYRRFLENVIRQHFDFEGVPLDARVSPASGTRDADVMLLACRDVAAFLIGSIPFGYLIGRVFYRTDLRARRFRQHRRDECPAHARQSAAALPCCSRRAQGIRSGLSRHRHCFPGRQIAEAIVAAGGGVGTLLLAVAALARRQRRRDLVRRDFCDELAGGTARRRRMDRRCAADAVLVGRLDARQRRWQQSRCGFSPARPSQTLYGALAALFIVYTHRENLARLRAGTENPIRLFKR